MNFQEEKTFLDINTFSTTISLEDIELNAQEVSSSIFVTENETTFFDVEETIIFKVNGQISKWYNENYDTGNIVLDDKDLSVNFFDSIGNLIDKNEFLMLDEEVIYNSFDANIFPNENISDSDVIFTSSQTLSIEIPDENFSLNTDPISMPHVRLLLFVILFVISLSLGVIFLINLIVRRRNEKNID